MGAGRSRGYAAVPHVESREVSVSWRDPHGDHVSFRVNDADGVDLYLSGQLRVRNLSDVRLGDDGRSLIVNGSGGPCVVVVPHNQDFLIMRVLALFQSHHGSKAWLPRPRWLTWFGNGLYRGHGYRDFSAFRYAPGRALPGYEADPDMAEDCCTPGPLGVSSGFTYLGESRGSYVENPSYIYVGEGAGDYAKRGCSRSCCCCCCCLILSILALLAGLVALWLNHWKPPITLTLMREWSATTSASATTASPPHFSVMNCTDAIWNEENQTMWSEERKKWCCTSVGVGCTSKKKGAAPVNNFDCLAGYSNWVKGWSSAKKAWCCTNHGRGCKVTTTTLPFDCEAALANWEKAWSKQKKTWCCDNAGKGCKHTTTAEPYECHDDDDDDSWNPGKQAWCCLHYRLHCFTTTTQLTKVTSPETMTTTRFEYDCDAGYAKWEQGWSSDKKAYCCKKTERGCEYDCDAGYANWEQGWSKDKQTYCCLKTQRGCEVPTNRAPSPEPVAAELTYDLNCFGKGAEVVMLSGAQGSGEGAFVSAITREQCQTICKSTPDCEAILFSPAGGGKCFGKRNVHVDECQPGVGYTTEILPGNAPWSKCAVFGDPHMVTWDRNLGHATRQFDQGDYWLVKSLQLSVQGRFGFTHRFPNASSAIGVAIGGSLIYGHKLVVEYIGPAFGSTGFMVTWDGQDILHDYPSSFTSADEVLIAKHEAMDPLKFHREARHTIGGTEADGNLASYLFEFPSVDLRLYVLKGPDNCNAVVEMKRLTSGQDGYCGNFNGDDSDDSVQALQQRGLADPIPPGQSLFGPMPQRGREEQAAKQAQWAQQQA